MVRDGVNPIVSNFEVTVEKLVYGGEGLARLDGRVVLAPYVLPGERIRAEVEREKPGLVRARTLEVIEPAAARVEARCPVFGRCGGCHYQHAEGSPGRSASRISSAPVPLFAERPPPPGGPASAQRSQERRPAGSSATPPSPGFRPASRSPRSSSWFSGPCAHVRPQSLDELRDLGPARDE